jgi:hypothetical protein
MNVHLLKMGFAKHFQNLNPKPSKVRNHGHIKLEGLYHEKVRILDRFKKQIWKQNKVKMRA